MRTVTNSMTVTRIPNGKIYNAHLVVDKGDLCQRYNATSVVPDFTVADKQPVVTYVGAVTAKTGAVPTTITVYWDNVEVVFASYDQGMVNTASAGLAAGTIQIFQKGDPATGQVWKLKFLKNIATPSATPLVGHILTVEGHYPSTTVIGSKPFDLIPLSESGYDVHIEAGASDAIPFTVDENVPGSQCTLVATVYRGGNKITGTGNMQFKWYRKDATESTGWKSLTETTDTLIITAGSIEAYAEFRVVVTIDGEEYSDTEGVQDVGDPIIIVYRIKDQNGNDASMSMNGDVPDDEKRVITAALSSRTGSTSVPAIIDCYWTVMSVDGALLNTWTANLNSYGVAKSTYNTTEFTLPAAWIDSLNGGAGLITLNLSTQITF